MKAYSIADLLIGHTYYPRSLARKYQYGEINYAEKRDDIYLDGYEAWSIRFNHNKWATIAIKVGD